MHKTAKPENASDADLEAAKARVRALEARIGVGCGTIWMMAAGDTIEQKRAAWRTRNDRRNFRYKNSLGRIVLDDLPHDQFIRAMLRAGFYVRPRSGPPTFSGAAKAFDRMVRRMITMDGTRVTMETLPLNRAEEQKDGVTGEGNTTDDDEQADEKI